MRAFSALWTRPYAMRHPGRPFELADYELLTTVLSALLWRRQNGGIRMITDHVGGRYYRSLGLSGLWNDGITEILDDIPYTIDPSTFWAAGKLYALAAVPAPCVMLDTDFIVWRTLDNWDSELTVIHREELSPHIYPSPDAFSLAPDYRFPSDWNWRTPACNTALVYFGSEPLRRAYLRQAMDFMHAARGCDGLIYMVFAEQRLLAMCAEAMKIPIRTFSAANRLFSGKQADFTHVWGFKQTMRESPALRGAFCQRCAERIRRDFPAYAEICVRIPVLSPYFSPSGRSE